MDRSLPGSFFIREPIAEGLIREWEMYAGSILCDVQTKYQRVRIGSTAHGTTLFCDDERQSSSATQLIYHEAMIWPALFFKRQLRNALVIGSSEGVVTKMLWDWCKPERVIHVDIDMLCVELCAKHLPYGYTYEEMLDQRRRDLLIEMDGREYLESNSGLWDIICVDLPDESTEDAPQNTLYDLGFLRLVQSRLTEGGIFITQAGCPTAWRNETLKRMWTKMNTVFPKQTKYFDSAEHEWAWMLGFNLDDLCKAPALSWPADKDMWPQTIHPNAIGKHFTPPSYLFFHQNESTH